MIIVTNSNNARCQHRRNDYTNRVETFVVTIVIEQQLYIIAIDRYSCYNGCADSVIRIRVFYTPKQVLLRENICILRVTTVATDFGKTADYVGPTCIFKVFYTE